jgi:hypothetical protein
MSVNSAGGVNFAIGGVDATLLMTLMQYEAESYISLGEVEDAGQFGDESTSISFTALKDSRTRKFKGPRDAGTMAVVCGADSTDDGQDAMVAAEATKFDYVFQVTLNDALTLSGTPTVCYFSGKVMSKRRNVGNVSNIVKYTFNVAINTAILEVAAT